MKYLLHMFFLSYAVKFQRAMQLFYYFVYFSYMIITDKQIIQGNWSLNIIQFVLTRLSMWDFPNGSAPFWRLYTNLSGEQLLFYKDQVIELTPDNIVIIPPNTSYRGTLKSAESYHLFIHFSLNHPISPVKPQLISLNKSQRIKTLILPVESCLNDQNRGRQESCTRDFSLNALALTSLCLSEMETPVQARPPLDNRIERVLEIMDKNLSEKLDMNKLADQVNLSTGGLTRLFKESTGQSPLIYLNEKRINQACELLHDTRLSLEEVADQCGFSNRYYFTRVFKRYRQNTPAAFRKMIE
jgi:AraC-like DNA-binding protein